MATVETQTEARLPAGDVYDGFMSYSHSGDDLLAPRLQAGLQRFAKPWWKRRALRIFRDEASLSANPHLWSSIVDAMKQSGWFVLLLSPAAAESEWVNREVEYWLEHKDADRIIPVVSDGEFAWSDGHVVSNAAPPSLYAAFADEPRWVDLRFARTEEQIDLNNASFRAAVADIASAIRGIPKDELESEEVRQHRRTQRTVAAAGIALLILAIAASGAAIVAVDRGNEATEQRLAAEENAAEADAQRNVAEQLEADARADALAASATAQLDVDPELALLLAIEAAERKPQPSALSAIHRALQRHRTVFQVTAAPNELPVATGATGGIDPSGELIVVAGHGPDIDLWEVGGDEPVWTYQHPDESSLVYSPRFTEDGGSVVAVASPTNPFDPRPDGVEYEGTGDRLLFLDAETGLELRILDIPGWPFALSPSAMPAYVSLNAPMPWVTGEQPTRAEVGMLDMGDGSFALVARVLGGTQSEFSRFGVPTIDAQGRYFAAGSGGPGQVIELETGETAFEFAGGISTLSADGGKLLLGGHQPGVPLELWDLIDGERLWAQEKTLTRAWFSDDELLVYGTSSDGSTYVFDASNGEQLHRLAGQGGRPNESTLSTDGRSLATFSTNFTARVWDLGAMQSEEDTYLTNTTPREHQAAGTDLSRGVVAVWGGAPQDEDELWQTTVVDLNTGETLATVTGGVPALSPDGTRLAYRAVETVTVTTADLKTRGEPGERPRVGAIRIVDLATEEVLNELEVRCTQYLMPTEAVAGKDCNSGLGPPQWDLEFSPDGRLLGLAHQHHTLLVWDTATGQIVNDQPTSGSASTTIAFLDSQHLIAGAIGRLRLIDIESQVLVRSADIGGALLSELVLASDGSLLVGADNRGSVRLFDPDTLTEVGVIAAHRGRALDVAISPDGTLIASAGDDAFVRVWDVADRSLVTEIEFDVNEIAAVEFIDDTHLFVIPGFGDEAIVITLDTDELLRVAQSRLTRSFTADECTTFGIDPCPTLQELQDR